MLLSEDKTICQGANNICNMNCQVYLTTRLGIQLEKRRNAEKKKKNVSVYVYYIAQYMSKRAK